MPEITPGFWWIRRKDDGGLSIVEVLEGNPLSVTFLGYLGLPDIDEASEEIDFIERVARPATVPGQR